MGWDLFSVEKNWESYFGVPNKKQISDYINVREKYQNTTENRKRKIDIDRLKKKLHTERNIKYLFFQREIKDSDNLIKQLRQGEKEVKRVENALSNIESVTFDIDKTAIENIRSDLETTRSQLDDFWSDVVTEKHGKKRLRMILLSSMPKFLKNKKEYKEIIHPKIENEIILIIERFLYGSFLKKSLINYHDLYQDICIIAQFYFPKIMGKFSVNQIKHRIITIRK